MANVKPGTSTGALTIPPTSKSGACVNPPVAKTPSCGVIDEVNGQRDEDEDWEDPLTELETEASEQTKKTLISKNNVPAFRILHKLSKHVVRAEHNVNKLVKLLEEKHLPKGLSPKRSPLNLPDMPIEIQLKWEKAHVELSRSFTEILREYWTKRFHTQQEMSSKRRLVED